MKTIKRVKEKQIKPTQSVAWTQDTSFEANKGHLLIIPFTPKSSVLMWDNAALASLATFPRRHCSRVPAAFVTLLHRADTIFSH